MTAINDVGDLTVEGDIGVLTLNSPPVNAPSAPVRVLAPQLRLARQQS